MVKSTEALGTGKSGQGLSPEELRASLEKEGTVGHAHAKAEPTLPGIPPAEELPYQPMDIAAFAKLHGPSEFSFGLEGAKAFAEALRDMADRVESGYILPQDVRMYMRAAQDDFTMRSLIIKYAEKVG